MFCSRCGAQIEEASRSCPLCGQVVGSPTIPGSTPVSAPPGYGGFWARFVAYLIDGLILGIPVFLVVIVLFFVFGGFRLIMGRSVAGPPDAAVARIFILGYFFVMLLCLVAGWLYFAVMESSARQATFGKAAMSLQVTDREGRPLTFGHATGRFFAKIISGMIPFAIGYIMAGFTEKKQALHDMIAGTLVLRK